jgi:competence protein ComEA
MPTISRRRALGYVAVLVALLVVGGRLVVDGDRAPSAVRPPGQASVRTEPAPARTLVVHVVGAVRRPGLYRLREGSRVDDAVRRAGGARPRAELDALNLAAPVADGQQVVVPVRAETGTTATPGASAPGTAASASAGVGKVHLSTATLEQLDALPGIGPVTTESRLPLTAAPATTAQLAAEDASQSYGLR